MTEALDVQVVDQFADKNWRLANLYKILDETNQEVQFVPNTMQVKFLSELWYLNAILKGRQHGFTTIIDLWILDECVFHPHQIGGIIAHNLDDVKKIFRRKIKYPYDRLPEGIREANPATNDSAQELVFLNKSEISVATSMRAGTLSYLHISEFGIIAHKYPEKAEEIVTGSFNTVHPGNYIFVESTGYGRSGHFYNLCNRARERRRIPKPLSKLDFKYHFYPWWMNPNYQLSEDETSDVVFTRQHTDYFTRIEKRIGLKLTMEQRAWYVKKKEWNGDLMLREYPSIDEEPFYATVKGSVFQEEIHKAREAGRITKVPHDPRLSVDTWWDIGRRQANAIWFVQWVGREARFIWYYENTLKGLPHYLDYLTMMKAEKGYRYNHHVAPHDMAMHEYGTNKTRFETALNSGYRFVVGQQYKQGDQIDAGNAMIAMSIFDEENCDEGLTHLEQFRYEWNENLQSYMENYRHDEHSHGSSAYMTGSMMAGMLQRPRPRARTAANKPFPT